MPGFDATGPQGKGKGTGGNRGVCKQKEATGQSEVARGGQGGGRCRNGEGRGRGMGGGQGRRRDIGGGNQQPIVDDPEGAEDEKDVK